MPRPGPRTYQPLAAYLAALPSETTRVTLTFAEIEAILGEPLPAGASIVSWWTNAPGRGSVRPWRQVGWRAVQLRLRQTPPAVTFVRADSPPSPLAPCRPPPPQAGREQRRGGGRIVDG